MTSPEIAVLKTDGTNCDEEMLHAFEVGGGRPSIVHINELREGTKKLSNFGGLGLPGGFANGDDIKSGKILANELTSLLSDQLQKFVDAEKPIIGVCNGFQVLIRSGLLPFGTLGEQQMTLTDNEKGNFHCRWIDLKVGQSACWFVQPEDFDGLTIPMQTAHGEGRFFGNEIYAANLAENNQVVFQYSTSDGELAHGKFPENPNGSAEDIAGICDPSGLILGMMPHPERSLEAFHPYKPRTEVAKNASRIIFENFVEFARAD